MAFLMPSAKISMILHFFPLLPPLQVTSNFSEQITSKLRFAFIHIWGRERERAIERDSKRGELFEDELSTALHKGWETKFCFFLRIL